MQYKLTIKNQLIPVGELLKSTIVGVYHWFH